jgi:hypothetical protein
MDGFALKGENTFGASQSNPKTLRIVDAIGAGDFCDKTINEGEAIVIATGAPIPEGADAVLMKEYTTTDGDELTIYSQVTPGENVSPKAEDIRKGEKILSKDTFIIGYFLCCRKRCSGRSGRFFDTPFHTKRPALRQYAYLDYIMISQIVKRSEKNSCKN